MSYSYLGGSFTTLIQAVSSEDNNTGSESVSLFSFSIFPRNYVNMIFKCVYRSYYYYVHFYFLHHDIYL